MRRPRAVHHHRRPALALAHGIGVLTAPGVRSRAPQVCAAGAMRLIDDGKEGVGSSESWGTSTTFGGWQLFAYQVDTTDVEGEARSAAAIGSGAAILARCCAHRSGRCGWCPCWYRAATVQGIVHRLQDFRNIDLVVLVRIAKDRKSVV